MEKSEVCLDILAIDSGRVCGARGWKKAEAGIGALAVRPAIQLP